MNFLEKLLVEWRVIRDAPRSAAFVTIILASIIWFVIHGLSATQMNDLESRIKLRDDQIVGYQSKLNVTTSDEAKTKLDKLQAEVFPKWPEPYRPISVVGKTFRNEVVPLDGYNYSNCEFYNVTFKYNGTTAVQFTHNNIHGSFGFVSDNMAVTGTTAMLRGFGALKDVVNIQLPAGNMLSAPTQTDPPKDHP